jgi:integrase
MWTIPAERMKAGRAHRVPLSDPALVLLVSIRPLALMQDDTPLPTAPIFFGPKRARPLSTASLLMLLCRMNRGDVTPHGFRSCFRDWCAERTNFPSEVAEMALAHRVGDAVERAYRRGDLFEKRRQLMEAWGRFCETSLMPVGDVVPLHAAQ